MWAQVNGIWEEHNQPIGSMGGTMGSLKSTALGHLQLFSLEPAILLGEGVGVSIEDAFLYLNQGCLIGGRGQVAAG